MVTYQDRLKVKHPNATENKRRLMVLTAQESGEEHLTAVREAKAAMEAQLEKMRNRHPICLYHISMLRMNINEISQLLVEMEAEMKELFPQEESVAA